MRFMIEGKEGEEQLDHIIIDGYDFGDRLLEGVMFKVTIVDGKPKAEPASKGDENYLDTLNKEMWLHECEAHVESSVGDEIGSIKGNPIWIEADEGDEVPGRPEPVTVGLDTIFGCMQEAMNRRISKEEK